MKAMKAVETIKDFFALLAEIGLLIFMGAFALSPILVPLLVMAALIKYLSQ